MRLHCVALLLAALTGANARVLSSRFPANPLDSRAGPSSQICANFQGVRLTVPLPPGGEVTSAIIGLPPCMCESEVPAFTDYIVRSLADLGAVDPSAVTQAFATLFSSAPSAKVCTYPEIATPQCLATDPCSFTCPNGLTKSGDQCVCAAPNTLCNGNCVPPTFNCPSSVSTQFRRWDGASECNARGGGHMACGVYGRGARAWECVDTDNDLESCGGCAVPLNRLTPLGVDCSAIPGVADVGCNSGACVIRRCLPGYALSSDASFCMRDREKDGVIMHYDSDLQYNTGHLN